MSGEGAPGAQSTKRAFKVRGGNQPKGRTSRLEKAIEEARTTKYNPKKKKK